MTTPVSHTIVAPWVTQYRYCRAGSPSRSSALARSRGVAVSVTVVVTAPVPSSTCGVKVGASRVSTSRNNSLILTPADWPATYAARMIEPSGGTPNPHELVTVFGEAVN